MSVAISICFKIIRRGSWNPKSSSFVLSSIFHLSLNGHYFVVLKWFEERKFQIVQFNLLNVAKNIFWAAQYQSLQPIRQRELLGTHNLEVCVPKLFLRQDGTGLQVTSQIAGTGTGLHMSGLVAWDDSGKIQKKYKNYNLGIPISFSGLRRDGSGPVLNGENLTGWEVGQPWMLGTKKFPRFSGKKIWYSKNENGNADL